MEIVSGVHLISGTIVNCFLIVDADGLTLIDTGLPNNAKKVFAALTALDKRPTDLRRILITHSDGDHVGCLAELSAASGARVYASGVEAEAIADGRASRELKTRGLQRFLLGLLRPMFRARPARVDEVLVDGQVLPVLGGLRVVETPGHTPGHLSFFSPSTGVLFGGDSMVSGSGGLRVSRGMNTWNEDVAKESVRKQAALGAKIVCVGHGPIVRDASEKFPSSVF